MTTPKTFTLPHEVGADLIAFSSAARQFTPLRDQADQLTKDIGEAMTIEVEHGIDNSTTLLYELLEAVALESGRRFALTADRAGVAAAKLTLADMAPAIGATQEGAALAIIRESLREPRMSYVMSVAGGSSLGPFDSHTIPCAGTILVWRGQHYRVDLVTEYPGAPGAKLDVTAVFDDGTEF